MLNLLWRAGPYRAILDVSPLTVILRIDHQKYDEDRILHGIVRAIRFLGESFWIRRRHKYKSASARNLLES